jgi:hypothetical protein
MWDAMNNASSSLTLKLNIGTSKAFKRNRTEPSDAISTLERAGVQGELRFRLRELQAIAQTIDLPHQHDQKLHGFQSGNRRLDDGSPRLQEHVNPAVRYR